MSGVNKSYHLGFLLLDGFSMIAFSNALDTFRLANHTAGEMLYKWRISGVSGLYTYASNGLSVNHSSNDLSECDCVFVCGGYEAEKSTSPEGRQLLRRLAENGRLMVGICTGAVALADAGLLEGYQATLHWEHFGAAVEKYTNVRFNENIYTLDRNRYTCSGGAAPLDLVLHWLKMRHGRTLASAVGKLLVLDNWRQGDSRQHLPSPQEGGGSGFRHVSAAVELMLSHLEDPLDQRDLSGLVGVTPRHLQRLFKQHFQQTPLEYYLALRLERSRQLLRQSRLTMREVALACGFASLSSFSRSYRNHFGYPPKNERQVGAVSG